MNDIRPKRSHDLVKDGIDLSIALQEKVLGVLQERPLDDGARQVMEKSFFFAQARALFRMQQVNFMARAAEPLG
jgi:hypothetical protein